MPASASLIFARMDYAGNVRQVLAAMDNVLRDTMAYLAKEIADEARPNAPKRSGLLRMSVAGKSRKQRGGKPGEYMATISTNTRGGIQPGHYELRKQGEARKAKHGVTQGNFHWIYRWVKPREIKYGYGADVELGRKNYTSTPFIRPALARIIPTLPGFMNRKAEYEGWVQRQKAAERRGRLMAKMADRGTGLDSSRFMDLGDE